MGSLSVSSCLGGIYWERHRHNYVNAASPVASSPLVSTVSNGSRISEIMKYGFPGLDNIRSFDNYVLSYDKRNRVPHWVFEHINPEYHTPKEEVDRRKCEFRPDESIHPYFRLIDKTRIIPNCIYNY